MTTGPVAAALYAHLFGKPIEQHRRGKRAHTDNDAFDALLVTCDALGLTVEEVWHLERHPEHASLFGITIPEGDK